MPLLQPSQGEFILKTSSPDAVDWQNAKVGAQQFGYPGDFNVHQGSSCPHRLDSNQDRSDGEVPWRAELGPYADPLPINAGRLPKWHLAEHRQKRSDPIHLRSADSKSEGAAEVHEDTWVILLLLATQLAAQAPEHNYQGCAGMYEGGAILAGEQSRCWHCLWTQSHTAGSKSFSIRALQQKFVGEGGWEVLTIRAKGGNEAER